MPPLTGVPALPRKAVPIPTTSLPAAKIAAPTNSVQRLPATRVGWGLLELLVISQTAIPAMLLLPGMQSIRAINRCAAFLVALTGLVLPSPRSLPFHKRHPSTFWVILLLVYLLGILLMSSDRMLPALAQYFLIFTVIAPVFWTPQLVYDASQLHRILWLILLTSGLNSLVGVLQVYDPDRWLPMQFSSHISNLNQYHYYGTDGRVVMRPCGLFDSPGAACSSGAWAAIVGFALFQVERTIPRRAVAIGCAFLGAAVIYLTLVRTSFVVVLVGVAVYATVLFARGQSTRAIGYMLVVMGTLICALLFAALFGGDVVVSRFQSLFNSKPTSLYYQSRGIQLEDAIFNVATDNILGVGLGSWGMVPATFGGGSRFAELQLHGWLLDGGIPLAVLYSIALIVAFSNDLRICMTIRSAQAVRSAACIAAINASTLVTILSFVPYNSPLGLQFWLLTGILHGVSLLERPRVPSRENQR
ncbi:MAG: hypothetical protein SH850_02580 [Planctomycetaceae bacterium]|nr:hypothetical protein [Planctomycetaceae bacterium]